MVDLSGGPDGPIEHGFSNTVFIIPAIVVIGLAGNNYFIAEKLMVVFNRAHPTSSVSCFCFSKYNINMTGSNFDSFGKARFYLLPTHQHQIWPGVFLNSTE